MKQCSFQDLGDLFRMKSLLSDILSKNPQSTIHPGDLDWRLFVMSAGFQWNDVLCIWEYEGGQLAGFMFAYPNAGYADLIIRPSLSGRAAEEQMLVESETHLVALEAKTARRLNMFAFADDKPRRELLEKRRYTGKDCRVHFARMIARQDLKPELPEGFRFLEAQDANYVVQRAQLHVNAFNPGSTMTPEKYRAVMDSPDYNPYFDVVVVAPDGRLAAFALAWIDPISEVGVFEPVGTHPEFQRRGLGKAALVEGMRRMRACGIETATVRTSPQLPGVIPFYQSAGFRIANTIWCYAPPELQK